jgi:hypothetical protein
MRIITFIEDYKVVKKILDYLGIYKFRRTRSPPKIHTYCKDLRLYRLNGISQVLNLSENSLDMVFDFFIHAFRLILVLNLLPLLFPLADQGDY